MKKLDVKLLALLLCAVVALSVVLTGCGSNEKNFPVALSDTTRSALELCSDSYNDGDLIEMYTMMRDGKSVKELHDEYPIDCLRKDDDGYHIIYQGNTRVLVLHFDDAGNWVETDKLHSLFRRTETRGKFDELQAGNNVTKVQKTDPTCYFPFLVDKNSSDLVTHHYTDDGYHTTILYDKDFNITSVSYEMM